MCEKLRIELELSEVERDRPYLHGAFHGVLEQPVVTGCSLGIVPLRVEHTASFDHGVPTEQRTLSSRDPRDHLWSSFEAVTPSLVPLPGPQRVVPAAIARRARRAATSPRTRRVPGQSPR